MTADGSRAAYDPFAWFYNRYWNKPFHCAAFPILERLFLPMLRPGARVLDVCCGTGYLAGLLVGRGFRVTGIDASAEMIQYARRAVPEAEFMLADAREFRLPRRFEGAVSTFDSLNHILDPGQLAGVFANVRAALAPGAPFFFDMLLEGAYQTHWGENFSMVADDHVLIITGGSYDPATRQAECKVTMFRRLDEWQRSDTVVIERAYTSEEIGTALAAAGFGGLTAWDARDLGMDGDLGNGRVFYAATVNSV